MTTIELLQRSRKWLAAAIENGFFRKIGEGLEALARAALALIEEMIGARQPAAA